MGLLMLVIDITCFHCCIPHDAPPDWLLSACCHSPYACTRNDALVTFDLLDAVQGDL